LTIRRHRALPFCGRYCLSRQKWSYRGEMKFDEGTINNVCNALKQKYFFVTRFFKRYFLKIYFNNFKFPPLFIRCMFISRKRRILSMKWVSNCRLHNTSGDREKISLCHHSQVDYKPRVRNFIHSNFRLHNINGDREKISLCHHSQVDYKPRVRNFIKHCFGYALVYFLPSFCNLEIN